MSLGPFVLNNAPRLHKPGNGAGMYRRRTLIASASLALLVALVTPLLQSESAQAIDAPPLDVAAKAIAGPPDQRSMGREVVSMRDANSRTYSAGNGRLIKRVWPRAVHYRDQAEKWRALDLNFRRDADGLYVHESAVPVRLPEQLGDDPATVRSGSAALRLQLRGRQSTRVDVDGNAVSYTLPSGVSIEYQAVADALKEDIVLRDARTSRFEFSIRGSQGLKASQLSDGRIEFRSGARVALVIPSPFMTDASGVRSDAVTHELASGKDASTWSLAVTADRQWLSAESRTFPVRVDPTIWVPSSASDCTLDSGSPTTAFCQESWLEAGRGHGHDHRSLLDLGIRDTLPDDAEVLEARLWAYADEVSSGSEVSVHRVTSPWAASASWNANATGAMWTTPGGDFDTTPAASVAVEHPDWVEWEITELVRGWMSETWPEHGVLLRGPESAAEQLVTFDSSETGNGPGVDVVYQRRVGDRPDQTYVSTELDSDTSLKVNVSNGNLVLRSIDARSATDPNLRFTRYYNSLWEPDYWGAMGRGGTATPGIDQWLQYLAGGNVAAFTGDGAAYLYSRLADQRLSPPLGYPGTLDDQSDVARLWPATTDVALEWDQYAPGVSRLVDHDGTISLSYDADGGILSAVSETAGNIAFDSDPRRQVRSATGPTAGQTWTYSYDDEGDGHLVAVTKPDGAVTTFEYENGYEGRLSRIEMPGRPDVTISYDTEGRVQTVTDGAAQTTYTYGERWTRVTAPNGPTKVHFFDAGGRVLATQEGTTPNVSADGELFELADGFDLGLESREVSAAAFDIDGIRKLTLVVDGQEYAAHVVPCTPQDCPMRAGAPFTVAFASLAEGPHTFALTAEDQGGSVGTSATWTVVVDRSAPSPPTGLSARFESTRGQTQIDWTTGQDQTLPGGQVGSGVVGGQWRVRQLDGTMSAWRDVEPDEPGFVNRAVGGTVEFQTRSVDALGNVSTPATFEGEVSSAAPRWWGTFDTCPLEASLPSTPVGYSCVTEETAPTVSAAPELFADFDPLSGFFTWSYARNVTLNRTINTPIGQRPVIVATISETANASWDGRSLWFTMRMRLLERFSAEALIDPRFETRVYTVNGALRRARKFSDPDIYVQSTREVDRIFHRGRRYYARWGRSYNPNGTQGKNPTSSDGRYRPSAIAVPEYECDQRARLCSFNAN